MIETPWGTWDHLSVESVAALFAGFPGPWWVAGGYAIDALAGARRREHDDVDIGVFAADQLAVQAHLAGWELHAADPPGTLRPWLDGETLPPPVHDIWARRDAGDSWRFQLMLNPGGPGEFVCRRDERIRVPLGDAIWWRDGVPYLAPEVQLFFKAKAPRAKDEQDFADCLPLLSAAQRGFLSWALELVHPGHPWLWALSG